MRECTRRLEFDAAHRVMRHESKCAHLHGHRYVADVTCAAPDLDGLGRVIDFSVVKAVVGDFIDGRWDHGAILNAEDVILVRMCEENKWKFYQLRGNPTAENLASELHRIALELLRPYGVEVTRLRIYETPNCWADVP